MSTSPMNSSDSRLQAGDRAFLLAAMACNGLDMTVRFRRSTSHTAQTTNLFPSSPWLP